MQETLTEDLRFGEPQDGFLQELKIGNEECKISIKRK